MKRVNNVVLIFKGFRIVLLNFDFEYDFLAAPERRTPIVREAELYARARKVSIAEEEEKR
ncbi:hypothetical protein DICVIV_04412 [Dictyocaulus viviparus]|uniref:Uncharacterized protein n=1 Tax=Dictyocaulus viviparus TaxID=29172 RepID=A0A0D8XYA1_DICVI|nr:hypothetical protein DICVIV_04412 [Dictyocaulus viviparus]